MSMDFTLKGHEYRYAVDQTVSAFHLEGTLVSSLSSAPVWTTATADYNGFRGICRCLTAELDDSKAQKIVRKSVYKAALASGMERPRWGSLTGVRPGKLMRKTGTVRNFMEEYDVSPERAQLAYEAMLFTEAAEQSLEPEDVCLYLGIPFCPTRCAYCSFVSQSVEKSMKLIPPYLEALRREIEAFDPGNSRIVSLYFGGGTPTTLSAPQLDELITVLEKKLDLSAVREFTVEAGRPDTITPEKMQVLKRHGVTRVSVNPQTMRDSVLEAIGRKHTAADVLQALQVVRDCGGFEVNMDLIAGLTADDFPGFRETMDQVLALAPENITVHTLALKNGSEITRKGAELPSPEEVGRMLDYAYEKLREHGYRPYYLYRQKNMSGGFENTGWTLPGSENLYNICMMEEICPVFAFGSGGSSKYTQDGKITRKVNPKYPLEYIEKYGQV